MGTTNAQSLTLGSSSTGSIILSPSGINRVGIGFSSSPLAALDVRSSLGTLPTASISGNTSFTTLLVDNSGTGSIFAASASGAPRFAINNDGTLLLNAGSGVIHTITSNATAAKILNIPDLTETSVDFCFSSGNCAGAGSSITGNGTPTQIAFFSGGAQNISSDSNLYFDNTNKWLGLGTSSPLARLDVQAGFGTTPIATFSGTTSFAGLVVDNSGSGAIFSASASGAPKFTINNSGTIEFNAGSGVIHTLISDATTGRNLNIPQISGDADFCFSTGNCAGAGSSITGSGTPTQIAFFSGGVQNITSDSNLYWDNTNKRLGLGASAPVATLDVQSTSGTAPVATFSGTTSIAGLVVDNSGTGDLLTASKSGATKFVIYNNGDLGFAGTTNVLSTINSNAISAQTFTLPNDSGEFCLSSNNCGFATTGENYWSNTGNLIHINNSTYDFAVGGDSTSSAAFAVTEIASGTPIASLSASINNNGISIDATNSTIQSLRKNTLTIGGNTTGNIVIDSGSDQVQIADNSLRFTGSAPIISSTNTLTINAFTLGGSIAGAGNNITNLTNLDLGVNNLSFNGNTITNGSNNSITIAPSGSGDLLISTDNDTGVSIGSVTTPAPLSISSNIGGNAALIVNQTGSGEIFTASASGVTRFSVTNTGDLVIGDDGSSFFVTLTPNTLDQDRAQYLPNEDGTLCIQGSLACGFALGVNYFQLNNNLLSPINSTYDFAIGGDSTTSASFAVVGVADGAPIATLAASTNNNGIYLDSSTSTIQSLLNNTLTIGGDSTGNILLSPGNGAAGSILTTNAETVNLTNTTTLNGTSLTAINGGATAINFDEFSVDASTGSVTIDDNADAGYLSIDGTVLDINSLTFVGAGDIITTGDATVDSSTNINLDADGGNIILLDNGTEFGRFTNTGTSLVIDSAGTATTIADDLTITGGDITNISLNFGNGSAATLGTVSDDNLTLSPNGTGNLILASDSDTSVLIGSASTPAPLSIAGGIGGNAALIVDQLNSGDIFTASASGVTRFSVTNTGDLVIGDDGSSFFVTLTPNTLDQDRAQYLPNEDGTLCIQGSLACGFALGVNYFQLNNNLLSPINSTYDFAIGGDSTTSASFAVVGVADGAPIATLAASTNNNGIYLDSSTSTIQSLLNNTLTIGGDSTGDIVLAGRSGSR